MPCSRLKNISPFDVILASKQNNEIEIGIKKGTKNKPVFCYNEIDTDTYEVTPVEVKVPS